MLGKVKIEQTKLFTTEKLLNEVIYYYYYYYHHYYSYYYHHYYYLSKQERRRPCATCQTRVSAAEATTAATQMVLQQPYGQRWSGATQFRGGYAGGHYKNYNSRPYTPYRPYNRY